MQHSCILYFFSLWSVVDGDIRSLSVAARAPFEYQPRSFALAYASTHARMPNILLERFPMRAGRQAGRPFSTNKERTFCQYLIEGSERIQLCPRTMASRHVTSPRRLKEQQLFKNKVQFQQKKSWDKHAFHSVLHLRLLFLFPGAFYASNKQSVLLSLFAWELRMGPDCCI